MGGVIRMVNVGFEIVYLVKLAKTEERGRCEFTASDSSRETAQMEGYSAGQINVVKGCVNQNRAHATFEHVFWPAEYTFTYPDIFLISSSHTWQSD